MSASFEALANHQLMQLQTAADVTTDTYVGSDAAVTQDMLVVIYQKMITCTMGIL